MPAKPRGKRDLSLTPTSDEGLDEIAAVSASDAARADIEWRNVAPKASANVLQAEVTDVA